MQNDGMLMGESRERELFRVIVEISIIIIFSFFFFFFGGGEV